jgi:hypothetical protein
MRSWQAWNACMVALLWLANDSGVQLRAASQCMAARAPAKVVCVGQSPLLLFVPLCLLSGPHWWHHRVCAAAVCAHGGTHLPGWRC